MPVELRKLTELTINECKALNKSYKVYDVGDKQRWYYSNPFDQHSRVKLAEKPVLVYAVLSNEEYKTQPVWMYYIERSEDNDDEYKSDSEHHTLVGCFVDSKGKTQPLYAKLDKFKKTDPNYVAVFDAKAIDDYQKTQEYYKPPSKFDTDLRRPWVIKDATLQPANRVTVIMHSKDIDLLKEVLKKWSSLENQYDIDEKYNTIDF